MKHAVVKIGLQGEVYWDGQRITGEAFQRALSQLKEEDGYLTYYREAPDEEPSQAVFETFQEIVASLNRIQLGQNARSEWGTLQSIEIEEAPSRFRFAMTRGYPFLLGCVPDGQAEPVMALGQESPPDEWFAAVDLLIRSDRIMETPLHGPESAFSDERMEAPSLHLAVLYTKGPRWGWWRPLQGPRWASWYPIEDIPSNVRSFYRGCRTLGTQWLGPPPWRDLSPDEVRRRAKEYEPPRGNR
jgi:hypothetical protein